MSPAEEYAARLAAHEVRVTELTRSDERIANARLLAASGIVAVVAARLFFHALALGWASIPLVAFVWLIVRHGSLRHARARAERAAAFYRRGLDRINDHWAGAGQTGERFINTHHVYAADLDVFGRGSLFELLSAVRTRMGEQILAEWLLTPAGVDEILARQDCLRDLRDRLDLREDLDAAGDSPLGVQPDALQTWVHTANRLISRWIRPIAVLVPALALATLLVWAWLGVGWPCLLVLLAEIAIAYFLRQRIDAVVHATERGFKDLELLSALLIRIERERFESPILQRLQQELLSQAQPASRIISRLGTIADFAASRENMLVRAFLEIPLLYSLHVALAAESWRAQHGAAVPTWLAATGRLEALSSLAMYAYEHPDDPFPVLEEGPARFEAQGIGHPLLSAKACVRNDVTLREATRVLLVSGSNMSGKSTLLRAVGVNTVLAMAGAPVRALALRLTPMQVGASIRVNDSLHEGSSRFYAEITRLRELYDLSERDRPLLFLLDELLQGTNSHDRRIGTEGILRAFIERGAIGLISTHDLALTEIQDLGPGVLCNVHFQDELKQGRMSFDFRLRDGVVAKSNGIELMRSIGLKV